MKYKALMLDIDGTTVPNRRDGMPSIKVREAITKADALIHVGVATSRACFQAKPVIEVLNLSGPSIISGGAYIFDTTTKQTVREHSLLGEDFSYIVATLTRKQFPFLIQQKYEEGPYDVTKEYKQVTDIVLDGLSLEQVKSLQQTFAHRSTIAVHWGPSWEHGKAWLGLSNARATKQNGIAEVAEILGIPTAEIIGVGDGANDFPLLMACGLKVAMGNANEDLKAVADYVAPTVEDDGVADVINKFILHDLT